MSTKPCPPSVTTLALALTWAAGRLEQATIPDPRLEARLLVAWALDLSPQYVFGYPEHQVDDTARHNLSLAVDRRARHEPMAHITGEKEFWSLPFRVNTHTLIPRPDSETLIDAVLAAWPDQARGGRLLDLGTGSGCLMLALLNERPGWTGVGVDRSAAALDVAAGNAQALGLADRCVFVDCDWDENPLRDLGLGEFDLVISNPPYIPLSDRQSLQSDVVDYEPHGALFAGDDGLDAYNALVPQVAGVLKPGGDIFLEVGIDQSNRVEQILAEHGYGRIGHRRDVSGIPRCVFAGIEKQ